MGEMRIKDEGMQSLVNLYIQKTLKKAYDENVEYI